MFRRVAVPLLVIAFMPNVLFGDWLRFRGPNGSGVSKETVPTEWSPTKNLKWKVALTGSGSSSPIIVGDRIFVTSYSGYGLSQEDPGDQADLRRHLICINANDGQVIWSKEIEAVLPEDPYTGIGVTQHGYASHTPVSDGERVYAFFGKSGVYAFDLDGNQLWQKSVGTESGARGWGSSSSPLLHKDYVIVPATAESQAMVALDKATGEEVWRQEAAGFDSVWGSPVLAQVDNERTDLVISVPEEIWGLNPQTGKLRWFCEAPATSAYSSAISHQGVVYAIEQGRGGGGGIAVTAGGNKDVTESHVVWQGGQASRIDTPILFDGKLYSFSSGVVQAYDAQTGEELAKVRLRRPGQTGAQATDERIDRGERRERVERRQRGEQAERGERDDRPSGRFDGRRGGGRRGGFGSQDYASPVVAGDKLYFQSRRGDCFVLGTADGIEQLAVNRVTTESEDFSATPAISNGALVIRSNRHLYCVAAE